MPRSCQATPAGPPTPRAAESDTATTGSAATSEPPRRTQPDTEAERVGAEEASLKIRAWAVVVGAAGGHGAGRQLPRSPDLLELLLGGELLGEQRCLDA